MHSTQLIIDQEKCLNWKFPYEVLCDELLHLN